MNEVNDEVSNKMMSIWGWVFGIFIIVAITVGGFKYYFSHKNLLYVRKNKKNDDKKEDSDLSQFCKKIRKCRKNKKNINKYVMNIE